MSCQNDVNCELLPLLLMQLIFTRCSLVIISNGLNFLVRPPLHITMDEVKPKLCLKTCKGKMISNVSFPPPHMGV